MEPEGVYVCSHVISILFHRKYVNITPFRSLPINIHIKFELGKAFFWNMTLYVGKGFPTLRSYKAFPLMKKLHISDDLNPHTRRSENFESHKQIL